MLNFSYLILNIYQPYYDWIVPQNLNSCYICHFISIHVSQLLRHSHLSKCHNRLPFSSAQNPRVKINLTFSLSNQIHTATSQPLRATYHSDPSHYHLVLASSYRSAYLLACPEESLYSATRVCNLNTEIRCHGSKLFPLYLRITVKDPKSFPWPTRPHGSGLWGHLSPYFLLLSWCLLLSSHTVHLLAFKMPRYIEFLPAPGPLDLLFPSSRKSLPTVLCSMLSLIHISSPGGPSLIIHQSLSTSPTLFFLMAFIITWNPIILSLVY